MPLCVSADSIKVRPLRELLIHPGPYGQVHRLTLAMADRAALRILVVDDDLFMLKLHAQILSGLGFSLVTTCDSGPRALADMDRTSERPDLILLDLSMPEMDGVEFLKELSERKFTGRLILVSGEDERVLQTVVRLARARELRVIGHLRKPIQAEALAGLVARWRPPSGTGPIVWKKAYSPSEIRAAIDNREFLLHYEPKVSLRTGEVTGVEALVRWSHPHDGSVAPDQFIGVAEQNGLIQDLTRFVFPAALAQAKQWRDGGMAVGVAINVSVDALAASEFADFAAEQAALVSIPTKDILIEVTESRLIQDIGAPLEVLTRLHLMRFQLSIDDFGTGYSSLSQLKDIPFNELKIDRGFVHKAATDQTVRTMYATCLGLAKELRMSTVAEGVEDQADWDFVRETECDAAQGYFIGRSMPGEAIPGWVAGWSDRFKRGFAGEA